jgi:hypothetical protein
MASRATCEKVRVMGAFHQLVRDMQPRLDQARGRITIVVERRLHDTVNSVVAALLESGQLLQYDGTLAIRLPDSKHPTKITLPWLQSHLARTFQFVEHGEPVELPPTLARFVLQRWEQFPEVVKLPVWDDPKRKHRKRGPG